MHLKDVIVDDKIAHQIEFVEVFEKLIGANFLHLDLWQDKLLDAAFIGSTLIYDRFFAKRDATIYGGWDHCLQRDAVPKILNKAFDATISKWIKGEVELGNLGFDKNRGELFNTRLCDVVLGEV